MPFQYTFRADDLESVKAEDRDLLENRDRELELYLDQPCVKLRRTTSTTYTATTNNVDITWEVEDDDRFGFIAVSGATLTVPPGLTGLYTVVVKNTMTSTSAANSMGAYYILVNGVSVNGNSDSYTGTSGFAIESVNLYLEAGDTLKFQADFTISSGSLTWTGARLWMTRVLA